MGKTEVQWQIQTGGVLTHSSVFELLSYAFLQLVGEQFKMGNWGGGKRLSAPAP